MRSWRFVVSLLIALAILPAMQVAGPAGAQSGDDAIFDIYVSQMSAVPPTAGPLEGTLAMDGGPGNTANLGVDLADVLVHVDFEIPQADPNITWGVSVAFRASGSSFHYLVIWPDGTWSFAPAGGGGITTGDGYTVGLPGALLHVYVVAVGDTAYIGSDTGYVATLDIGSSLESGDVTIAANLIGATAPGAAPMNYVGFAGWDLSGAAAPSQPVTEPAEPSPEGTETVPAPTPAIESGATALPEDTPPAGPESGTPAGDDEAIFNSYLQQSLSSPILFGPVTDTILHVPDEVSFFGTGVEATDFIARVECLGTSASPEGYWDCGFIFRGASGTHYRVAYVSDGYWFHSEGASQPLISGTNGPVSTSPDAKVVLNLIAVGDKGYFGINDQFISTLDLSSITTPGRVELASAFFSDTYIPDGGVSFEDFVIWSLDDGTAQVSPTAEVPGPTASPEGTTATGELPGVSGNSYTSPTYGYTFTWPEGWTPDRSETEGTTDYLGLNNGVVVADLIAETFDPAVGNCFDRIVDYYENNSAYSEIQSAVDSVSALPETWEITGILTLTHTTTDGVSTPYVNYVSCSQLPGQDAMVSLEQFVPISEFRNHVDAMDELRAGFSIGGGAVPTETATTVETSPTAEIVEPTPATVVVEPSPTAVTGGPAETPTEVAGQSNVVGNTYTSPTFGYSLTWDDRWSVVAEQSLEGVDFLRIAEETLTADLYAEVVTNNTPMQCVDALLNYYVNDEMSANAQFVTDAAGSPLVTDFGNYATALISYDVIGSDGSTTEQFSYITCVRMEEQGATVVLEVYMSPADFVLKEAIITELQQGLTFPGSEGIEIVEPVEQTPVVESTPETGTSVSPPEVEIAQSATFILSPMNNSGVQGTGTLEAQTRLVIVTAIVIGANPGDIVTIQRGSCEALAGGAEPDYIIGELDQSGLLREEIRVRLAALTGEEQYSVVVYAAGEDFDQVLACGPIG